MSIERHMLSFAGEAVLCGPYADRLVLLREGSKVPILPGYLERIVTLVELRWHFKRQACNLGLKLGGGVGVVDADGGPESRELAGRLLGIDTAAGQIARTDKGVHIWVRTDLDRRIIRWRGHMIDVLAKGFAVIPPSVMATTGFRRTWERGMLPVEELPFLDAGKVIEPRPPRLEPAPPVIDADRYAAAALRKEAGIVASAEEGTRHAKLNRAAFSLGTLVGAGRLTRGDVEAALTATALASGLGEVETARTIKDGLEAGMKRPRGGKA